MTYLQQVDEWITSLFELGDEELRKQIKAKLLESYRNGQRACPRCRPRVPAQPVRAK